MRIQQSPQPQMPKKPESPPRNGGDQALKDWADQHRDQIQLGQNLVVDLGDGHRYVVSGTKVGPAHKTFSVISQFITAGVQEVQAAIQAGPSLALTGATEVVKPMVLQNVPYEVSSQIEQWYQPGVMGVSVGLSVIKFIQNYHAHKARQERGKPDSFVQQLGLVASGVHIATCTLGLGGAVVGALVPSLRGAATTAQGVALAGNVVAFGINWLEYFNSRRADVMPLGDVKKPQ